MKSATDSDLISAIPILKSATLRWSQAIDRGEVEASADNGYLFLEAILRDHTLFQVLTANDKTAPPVAAQPFIDSVTLK